MPRLRHRSTAPVAVLAVVSCTWLAACGAEPDGSPFGPATTGGPAGGETDDADGGAATSDPGTGAGDPTSGPGNGDADPGSDGSGEGEAETTAGDTDGGEPIPPVAREGIWISAEEIMELPTEGPAWGALLADAMSDPGTPNISDQDQDNNVLVMARALVCIRLEDDAMCETVREQVMAAIETENGGRTLALGRELLAYVISADLVGLSPEDDEVFSTWLAEVIHEDLDGRTLVDTHEERPNNWGTHAGASRLAVAVYLGDGDELQAAADVFQGWLGARDVYAGFAYGELDWQSDPNAPVGINPVGAAIDGHDVDGVIPDDQRRAGPFEWPPPQENYVYEGLQGALAQAVILHRRGQDAFGWEDQALERAFAWLHDEADYVAEGDDTWQPFLVNHYYATDYPTTSPSTPGKNVGYTDWTHAGD